MEEVRERTGVKVLPYIGNCFEEASAESQKGQTRFVCAVCVPSTFTMMTPRQASGKPVLSCKGLFNVLAAHALISKVLIARSCATSWKLCPFLSMGALSS